MQQDQADGFGLEILSKLKDVKSKDNQVTLLHFIDRVYMRKLEEILSPSLVLPAPEPGDINRAAIVNSDDVHRDLETIQKKLKDCKANTQKVIDESTKENLQPLKDKMTSFLKTAAKQLNGEIENIDECRKKILHTMSF